MSNSKQRLTWLQNLTYFDVLAFVTLLVLAGAVFPLGSNRPLPASVLAGALACLLILWALGALAKKPIIIVPKDVLAAGLLILAVLGWSWLQTVTWTPAAWHHPVWQVISDIGADTDAVAGMVAINSAAAGPARMNLLGGIAAFTLFFVLGQRGRRVTLLLYGFMLVTTFYAVLGLYMALSGWQPLDELRQGQFIHSTFVNRNHFATYCNIGLAIALVLLFDGSGSVSSEHLSTKASLVRALTMPLEQKPFVVMGFGILLLGSLGSISRGGFISLCAGIAVLFFLRGKVTKKIGWPTFVGAGGFAALLLAVILLVGDPLLSRFDDPTADADLLSGGRLAGWLLTIELIKERPLLGYGLGSYIDLFLMHADERFRFAFDHAHNDYLETAAELGLPATFALVAAIAILVARTGRLVFQTKRVQRQAASAAFIGSIIVGTHALVDFSLTIPAVSIAYGALLGLGTAQIKS